MRAASPERDGSLFDGERRVGYHGLGRENQPLPQPVAGRAGTVWRVEGEVAGQWLAEAQVAMEAGQMLAQLLLLPAALLVLVLRKQRQDAISFLQGELHGIIESAGLRMACYQAIDHRLQGVPFGLRQLDILLQGFDFAVSY